MARRPVSGRLILLLLHAVFVQALTYAVRPTLSYAVLDTGGSPALLGVIAAAFAIPALLLALPAGHTVDRIGERPAMVLGAAALLAASLLAGFADGSFVLLIVATVLLGCGHLASVVAEQAMVGNIRGRNSDSRFGVYTFAASIGQAAGPLLLVLPGGSPSIPPINTIFFACSGIAVVILGLSVFLRSTARVTPGEHPSMRNTAVLLLRMKGMWQAMTASAIVLASVDLFLAYIPALGHERGLGAEAVGVMLVARSVMAMVSRLFLGPLIRRVGRRNLLVWSIAISALTLCSMAIPMSVGWLVAVSALYGFAIGTCQPVTMSWVSELAPPGSRGLAMSLRLATNRAGQTALPLLLGSFAVATGAAGVLAVTGLALVGAAVAGASVDKKDPE